MLRSLFFLCCVLLIRPLYCQGPTEAFEAKVYRAEDGSTLPYRLLLPENYDPGRAYPLVLFLHGAGERGADNDLQLVHGAKLFTDEDNRRQFPAIVVFPQCPAEDYWARIDPGEDAHWQYPLLRRAPGPLKNVIGLLAELEKDYRVNPHRRYLGGLSMGGFGTFELLARKPDYFAAAFPICGGGNVLAAPLMTDTDLWVFHGGLDDVVPPVNSRKMVEALQEAGASVRYTEYPKANHNSWDSAFAEPQLLPWLFSNHRYWPAGRYAKPVFQQVQRTTMAYAKKEGETLELDFYEPSDDAVRNRPLILYVHGGGFAGGSRDEPRYTGYCQRMAKRGYAVVSMSYRLTMKGKSFSCDQPTENKIRTFQMAVEDIRSATNFLLERKDMLGIHPDQIILVGSSAGAEAVLHAAYWTDEDLLPRSPRLPDGFAYGGVVSLAGAMVDVTDITKESAIPTVLYHGTCDNLVPFDAAPHHYCDENAVGYLPLFGANAIAKRLDEVGGSYHLVASCGGRHEWNDRPLFEYVDELSEVCYKMIVTDQFHQASRIIDQGGDCGDDQYPACTEVFMGKE